jgi:hypothetical protein
MKKRFSFIVAICALIITLSSCTTAHRAARRTDVNPAPARTHTQKTERPSRHALPNRTVPSRARTMPHNRTHDNFRNDGRHDGAYRAERDGEVDTHRTTRDGFTHNNRRVTPVRPIPRVNRIPATRIPVR